MRVPRLLLALLLALALAPSVQAQVPTQNPVCGPIAIEAIPAPAGATRAGEAITLVVPVTNGGQIAATITVTAQTSSAGWAITATPAPSSVPQAATQEFEFTVSPSDASTGAAQVSFSASGTCDSPLGAACGAACNAGTANANVGVPYDPPQGFRIPGLDDLSIAPEYIIASILLIAIAAAIPFLVRRRKGGILAQCPEPLKMVKPGRGTSFPIELRNAGKDPGVAHFEVGPVPEGWSAFMPLPEVQLAARESRSLWLMVRSPATAQSGDAVDVELRLKDARGNDGGAVKVRAEVNGSAAEA